MAVVVPMPRQGNTVESCVLVSWRVREGERVSASDVLCEVETDKAVFEVASPADGVVLKLLAAEGDDVPVLAAIAAIGEAGEAWEASPAPGASASAAPAPRTASPAEAAPAFPPAGAPLPAGAEASSAGPARGVSPRARALAAKEAVDAAGLEGSGPGGRVIERDVRAAAEARPPLGAAARSAVSGGAAVPATGGGIGGRVLLSDLAGAAPAALAASAAPGEAAFPGPFAETQVKGIRKVIADRMRDSLATTAQFTLHASAPAGRLRDLRARFKAAGEDLAGVTIGDLVLFVVSRVLAKHPACNARKEGDLVKTYERVHLGHAVDTPRGLMVPVIRNADRLGLARLSAEAKRLAALCVEGKATPDDLHGSTFTVSNLGALGVDYFTPVINAPEVCVLGVGALLPKAAWAEDGTAEIVPSIGLSLTSDHQVVDGAPAARLLRDLCAAMADADLWLAR